MLRKVGDQFVVVALGKASEEFHGMIRLNEVGAFIWKELENNKEQSEIEEAVWNSYEVNREVAKKDVMGYINELREANLIIE